MHEPYDKTTLFFCQDPDGRYWYYMGRRSSGKRKESRKDEQAESKRKVEDEAEKQEMVISLSDHAWMRVDDGDFMPSGNSSSNCTTGSAFAPKVVTDELMMKLQQALLFLFFIVFLFFPFSISFFLLFPNKLSTP